MAKFIDLGYDLQQEYLFLLSFTVRHRTSPEEYFVPLFTQTVKLLANFSVTLHFPFTPQITLLPYEQRGEDKRKEKILGELF